MEWIVTILQGVAAAAPGLIAAWTGHESDEKAIESLRTLTDGLKNREDRGEWDRDLEERRARLRGDPK